MDFALVPSLPGHDLSFFLVNWSSRARIGRLYAGHTVEFGYVETLPPALVNTQTMTGTGQLPKFAEDLYQTGDKWLIPTAEVPLTNIVADKIMDNAALPMR